MAKSYQGIRLQYLLPALIAAIILAAGPTVAILGTGTFARYLFFGTVWILAMALYSLKSVRKQTGIGLIAMALEFAGLVIIYTQPNFPLRSILENAVGPTWAQMIWQIAVGVSGLFLLTGTAILLWGIRAHRAPQNGSLLRSSKS